MSFVLYKSIDDLIVASVDTSVVEIPSFPVPPEDIDNLDQLLHLIEFLKLNKLDKIAPKYRRLIEAESIISEFNEMVGLEGAKSTMATQILSLCNKNVPVAASAAVAEPVTVTVTVDRPPQRLLTGGAGAVWRSSPEDPAVAATAAGKTGDKTGYLHTVIYGPPGCGKTTMAEFLAKLYVQFGLLGSGKIVRGERSNMIGEHIGETAIKTKNILTSALGGVFFIDEVYQLGHAADGNRCAFGYECINTLMQFITAHDGQIVVIIAGYEQDVKDNFFAQNQGLERRFPWKYTLEPAKAPGLFSIFQQQARKAGYELAMTPEKGREFFVENKEFFTFSGGDTQVLFDKCKMKHEKRMFASIHSDQLIQDRDLAKGFELFREHKEKQTTDLPDHVRGFYS